MNDIDANAGPEPTDPVHTPPAASADDLADLSQTVEKIVQDMAELKASHASPLGGDLAAMDAQAQETHGVSLASLLATVIDRVHGIDLHARANKDGVTIGPAPAPTP